MSWGENRSEHELAVIKTFSWSTSTQDKSPFRVWRQPVLIPLAEDSLYVGGIKNQHSRNNHKLVYEPQEQRHRVSRNLALPLFFTFLFQFISFCTVFFLFASTLLNFYGCWLSCMKMASRDKHIKYPPRAPIGMGLQANLEFRQRPPSPGPLAYLFENKFWITNRHRHDIDMTSLWQGCAARTTRERVAQNFRTSFAFECELRAPHSRCFCVCSCVCVFAKQLTFVLARASGDPFAQIRLIKVPLFLCADSTRRTLSGSQKHSQQEPHKMAVLAIK